jgi:tetratricopeptide (TPR) repeat protein
MTPRVAPLVIGLVAVLAVGPLGCTSDEQKVADHVAAAEKYQEAKDLRSALVELRAALRIEPKSADLNMRIADTYQAMGSPRAGFFYGEAYRLDKSLTRAALMQVPTLYDSDPEGALAIVDEVIEREPANVDAYRRRAEVLLVKSDTDAALTAAHTAVELDPESLGAHRTVTTVYRAKIREELLLGRDPGKELFEKALAAADRAEAVAKDQTPVGGPWYDRLEKALIYVEWDGHEKEAQQAVREAFGMAKDADDESGIQTTTRDARRIAAASSDREFRRWALERWVEVDPGAVRGWRRLAALQRELGGSSDEVWNRALTQRPDDVALHAEYVRVLVANDEADRAFEYLASLPPALAQTAEMKALAFELYLDRGDLEEAKTKLAKLQADYPDDPLTKLSAAAYDLRTGNAERGLQVLRILAGQVERADVFRRLAFAEARAGNGEAALSAVERAIELRPNSSNDAYELRLRLLAAKGDWLAVLRGWREMRKQGFRPGPTSTSLRIQALYELGRRDVAKPLLETAIKSGELSQRDILLFNKYESSHQPHRADELARRSWQSNKESVTFTRVLVNHALARKDVDEALRILDENRKLTGHSADPIRHARMLLVKGRGDEAEALAIEAFQARPRPFGASPLLVEILGRRGKSDLAVSMLEKSRADGTLQPAGLWQLGRIYFELGEYEKAQPPLEEAIAKKPDFSPAISDLALVLAERGKDLDRAVALARKVKGENPENPAIADTLGYVYLKKGLAEPAAFEFRSAIELAKVRGREKAAYHYHLGLALKAQGRDDEAGRAFDEALRIQPDFQAARDASG